MIGATVWDVFLLGVVVGVGMQIPKVLLDLATAIIDARAERRMRREIAEAALAEVVPLRSRLKTQEVPVNHAPWKGDAS